MAALTLWFKFLYVLRSFSRTSYLIRSLVEVTKDMWVFLLVLFIVVIGYGDAFVNLSMADRYLNPGPSDEKRLRHVVEGGYVGAIEYGILELKGNDWVEMSPFAYCVSVTAFVLLLVIMMNLLIAIVSATFERVTSSSV